MKVKTKGARGLNAVEEASRCLLCHEPPCAAACPAARRGEACDPAAFLRAVRFGLGDEALENMRECKSCKRCEKACIHYDFPLRITAVKEAVGGGGGPNRAGFSTGTVTPRHSPNR